MHIADLKKMGFLPLQDWDPTNVHVSMRNVPHAVRVLGHDPEGRTLVDMESMGDLVCAGLWKSIGGSREFQNAWSFAMPSVITHVEDDPEDLDPTVTQTRNPNAVPAKVQPIGDLKYAPDPRFFQEPIQDKHPLGTKGLTVPILRENRQELVFFPDRELTAVNAGLKPSSATVLWDTDPTGKIDRQRGARLQSMFRVVKPDPNSTPHLGGKIWKPTPKHLGVIALNLAGGSRDGVSGGGLVFDHQKLQLQAPSQGPPATAPAHSTPISYPTGGTRERTKEELELLRSMTRPKQPGQTTSSTPPPPAPSPPQKVGLLGALSARYGGPVEVGSTQQASSPGGGSYNSCQHSLGHAEQSQLQLGPEEIRSAHLSTSALVYESNYRDGPVDFRGDYPRTSGAPFFTDAGIAYDSTMPHTWEVNGKLHNRRGKWRVWSTSFASEQGGQKDPPPLPPPYPPQPPQPPPPWPPGGGGGGGKPGGGGTPPLVPPPSTSGWIFDQWRINDVPSLAGAIAPYLPGVTAPGGSILTPGHGVIVLPQGEQEKMKPHVEAGQPVIANPSGGRPNTVFNRPILSPGLLIRATPGNKLVRDTSRGVIDLGAMAAAPAVMEMRGYGNQTASGGWKDNTGCDKPMLANHGVRSAVQGGATLGPPGYAVAAAMAGETPKCGRKAFLTLPGVAAVAAFGTPHSDGTITNGFGVLESGGSLLFQGKGEDAEETGFHAMTQDGGYLAYNAAGNLSFANIDGVQILKNVPQDDVVADSGYGQFIAGTDDLPYFLGGDGTLHSLSGAVAPLDLSLEDASTNGVTTIATLEHLSTGTVVAGFGASLDVSLEDDSGSTQIAGRISVLWTDDTAASADADLVGYTAAASSVVEQFRFTSTGTLRMREVTSPSTPASGFAVLYTTTDGWRAITDGGTKHNLVVTEVATFTPSGSWSSNTTYTGTYQRVGNVLHAWVEVATSGSPTAATFTLNIPLSLTVDEALLPSGTTNHPVIGVAHGSDAGTGSSQGIVRYDGSANNIIVQLHSLTASSNSLAQITNTAPWSWTTNDYFTIEFRIPIAEWNDV